MKTILAKVTEVREPLEGSRTVTLEWKQFAVNSDGMEYNFSRTVSIEDLGEFHIKDEVAINITKVK